MMPDGKVDWARVKDGFSPVGDMLNGVLGGIALMVPLGIRMHRKDAAAK